MSTKETTHRVTFVATDGSIRRIPQTAIVACPHCIMDPTHYRADDSCRCNDPTHTEMVRWGYAWHDEKKRWWVGTYRVIRMFQHRPGYREVVAEEMTLEQAQAHCGDPETSSSTATSAEAHAYTERVGPWFDGYEEE